MATHRILSILTLLVLLSAGSFAQSDSASRTVPPAATTEKQAGEKPAEAPPAAHSDSSYVIGDNDVLAISVWKEPDISRTVPVRSDG
ncbi:MAG: polysaccharide biosynthesis/export family protein, partial [Terriglobales bacterium]